MMGIESRARDRSRSALAVRAAGSGRASGSGSVPSRLPRGAVIALVLGTLGLSHRARRRALAHARRSRAAWRSASRADSHGRAAQRSTRGRAVAGTALAPALGEELLCRGVLQRTLVRALGPLAAIATARRSLFGWLHVRARSTARSPRCSAATSGSRPTGRDSTRPRDRGARRQQRRRAPGIDRACWLSLPAVPGDRARARARGAGARLGLVLAAPWGCRRESRSQPGAPTRPTRRGLLPARGS